MLNAVATVTGVPNAGSAPAANDESVLFEATAAARVAVMPEAKVAAMPAVRVAAREVFKTDQTAFAAAAAQRAEMAFAMAFAAPAAIVVVTCRAMPAATAN